jgi:hypothetical protein
MSFEHTGMIKDDRYPCGYRFDYYCCCNMKTCNEEKQFKICFEIDAGDKK